MLARGLASRVGHIDDEVLRLLALARGEAEPDLDLVRATWQMFVSPTAWSWRPFAGLWRWDAPPCATRSAPRWPSARPTPSRWPCPGARTTTGSC